MDSGEMYSPDEQGEYMLLDGTLRFSMQGLSNAQADVGEGITEPPAEEYTMMLEVMMADHPGRPRPPAFSWNVGMVMHVLKNDPGLRELEHVQVDGPGTAYLFFLPTLPLASYPWWRPGSGLLLPLTVDG